MRKLVSLVTLSLIFAAAGAAKAAILAHVNQNDLSGVVTTSETLPDGTELTVNLFAYKSGAQDSPGGGGQLGQATGFLSYNIARCTADGACTVLSGFGNIPQSSFTGNARNARLLVDTSQVAGFTNEICSLAATGEFTCVASSGGLIDTRWTTASKASVSHQAGHQQYDIPGQRLIINGSLTSVNGVATGTVVGTTIPAGGYVNVQKITSATIVIEKANEITN